MLRGRCAFLCCRHMNRTAHVVWSWSGTVCRAHPRASPRAKRRSAVQRAWCHASAVFETARQSGLSDITKDLLRRCTRLVFAVQIKVSPQDTVFRHLDRARYGVPTHTRNLCACICVCVHRISSQLSTLTVSANAVWCKEFPTV